MVSFAASAAELANRGAHGCSPNPPPREMRVTKAFLLDPLKNRIPQGVISDSHSPYYSAVAWSVGYYTVEGSKKIYGLICAPTTGEPYPVVIYNHGGTDNTNGGLAIKETFNPFAEQNFDRQRGCDGLQINCATD
jgi:hypothetical protein